MLEELKFGAYIQSVRLSVLAQKRDKKQVDA